MNCVGRHTVLLENIQLFLVIQHSFFFHSHQQSVTSFGLTALDPQKSVLESIEWRQASWQMDSFEGVFLISVAKLSFDFSDLLYFARSYTVDLRCLKNRIISVVVYPASTLSIITTLQLYSALAFNIKLFEGYDCLVHAWCYLDANHDLAKWYHTIENWRWILVLLVHLVLLIRLW